MLTKPWKYKEDWLVWPNAAIDNMSYNRVDCADTINGVCYYNIPIEECIDKSTDGFGYHVQFKNSKSLCVPLRTSLYPDINAVYKVVNQDVHSKLDDVSISTFINTKKYEFPPLRSNIFFYFDVLLLRNCQTGLILSDKKLDDNRIEFLKEYDNNVNIQIIPKYSAVKQLTNNENILYGAEFNIIIEKSTLFLTFNSLTNTFIWTQSNIDEVNTFFKIIPLNMDGVYDKSKLNTPISYADKFTIFYSNNIALKLNSDNILIGEYTTIEKLSEESDTLMKSTFCVISKMIGYYCENDQCKPVPLINVTRDIKTDETLYNNSTVGRNKDCWGACKYWDKETNSIPEYSTKKPPYNFISNSKNKIKSILLLVFVILLVFILYLNLR